MNEASKGLLPERTIHQAVEAFLRAEGYSLVPGVRVRTWRPDIVAVRGDEVVVVEVKGSMGDPRRGLTQAAVYAADANCAYLALPGALVDEELLAGARALGVGVLSHDRRLRVRVQPRRRGGRPGFLRRVRGPPGGVVTPVSPPRKRPALSEVLRQREIVERLLSTPGRRYTVRELASVCGRPYATTWRFVSLLVSAGILLEERIGRSRVVSVNPTSPLLPVLRQAVTLQLSPHRHAAKQFVSVISRDPNVLRVLLFGSVARGDEVRDSDVDVAAVVRRRSTAIVRQVRLHADRISERTGMSLVPLTVTEAETQSNPRLAEILRGAEVLYARP